MSSSLHEVYEFGFYDEKDQVKYDLICKYRHKVSKRLLEEEKRLYDQGKKEGKQIFDAFYEVIARNNVIRARFVQRQIFLLISISGDEVDNHAISFHDSDPPLRNVPRIWKDPGDLRIPEKDNLINLERELYEAIFKN